MIKRLRIRLSKAEPAVFAVFAIVAAFSTYLCMYAFRKPFTAATYDGQELWGLSYKVVLVISQVMGYMISKFVGIYLVSGLALKRRIPAILLLICLAWLSLLGAGWVDYPYSWIFLFLNGLPLGMIWGIVFSFLEGRKLTELLGAGMAASFIVGSGWVKAVARYLMIDLGISEAWMPFATGAVFVLPLFLSVGMLSILPPPNKEDIESREAREPMNLNDRINFIKKFWPGILAMVATFVVLTAYRDFRDKFEVEIWEGLGYAPELIGSQLASANTLIGFTVTFLLAFFFLIKNSRQAYALNLSLLIFNSLMLFATMFLFLNGLINAYWWMVLIGFWMYLSYVSYHNVLFERFVTISRTKGNIGFLMYIADSFGYLGSIVVLLYKELFFRNEEGLEISWLEFFYGFTYIAGGLMILFTLLNLIYYFRKFNA
ncbi:MAG: DUF5690 family protein [Bacteroidia bacterium]|nr:DUF5690 family protein [Bacteroidia bacterium]